MKEIFIDFLKRNKFYDAWIEGFNLDNELYDDVVSLNYFLKVCPEISWFYDGISSMSLALRDNYPNKELKQRQEEWREKYLTKCLELDDKWMDLVRALNDPYE